MLVKTKRSERLVPSHARVILFLSVLFVLIVWASGTARADPIVVGIPVIGMTSTPAAPGMVAADGTITFYIPLQASSSGTYGVGTIGTAPDTATGPRSDGYLDMWLRFSPVGLGSGLLTLDFSDLDLTGVNDPLGFLESIEIFNTSGTSLAFFDSSSDPGVLSANNTSQSLGVNLSILSDPFFVRLHFSSSLPSGTWRNTAETVRATVQVPEGGAGALFLLGLSLLGTVVVKYANVY